MNNKYANFNRNNLPTIIVKFLNNDITEESYKKFIDDWDYNDNKKEKYNYFFDISLCLGTPNLKYAYKLSKFIQNKKNEEDKYLEYSIIYTNRSIDIYLLNIIFTITSPIAKVYIIDRIDKEYLEDIYNKLNNKEEIDCIKKYE